LFHKEGQHYNKKYGIDEQWYIEGPNQGVDWSDQQIDEIVEHSANLRRLEIYGGEPLIDKKLPMLLGKLIESGQSQYIDLNVSTNVTRFPSQEWINIVSHYKSFNLNLSIDGLGQQFEYLRHPARWNRVEENIHKFVELFARYDHFFLLPTITVSTMNIYYLPELIDYLKKSTGVFPHLNLVMRPFWYRISNIHESVKSKIISKLEQSGIDQLIPYADYMRTNAAGKRGWEQFKFWTQAMDEYRGESFADTFPELYQLMVDAGQELS
jgi:sulfatase maturation enzyme AslB (radical SAM superfamily)